MKLIKNYLYNLIYQVFVLIVPLVTVPYISRVLGAYGVGINAYTNSVVSYFILFGNLGVLTYGNRTIAYSRDDKKATTLNFWEITLLRLLTVSISVLAYLIFISKIGNLKMAFLAQLPLLIASIFDISWFFMGMEEFDKTVIRNVLVKLVSLGLIFWLVKSKEDTIVYILILTVSQLVGNILLWPYLKKYLTKVQFKELNLIKHFLPAIQLFIPQIAIQVYVVVNKTMLGNIAGVSETGFFDNADKIVKVLLAVVTATGVVMLPRMANEYIKGKMETVTQYLNYSINFANLIAFPLTFGLIGVAKEFSLLFFGEEFIGIESILMVLSLVIIAISWSNVIGQQFLLPLNKMNGYTGSVFFGAIINILLNLILIPKYSVMGAAIGATIAEFSVTFYQLIYVHKLIPVKLLFADLWKYMLSSAVMFFVVKLLGNYFTGVKALMIMTLVGGLVYSLLIVLLRPMIIQIIHDKAIIIIKKKSY